jgi:ribonuclease BN (tRNA processing enzyme)
VNQEEKKCSSPDKGVSGRRSPKPAQASSNGPLNSIPDAVPPAPDFIKFLGTGGARFVVSQQMRASGGIWLSWQGVQVHIDPGPGALVKCLASHPKLDPFRLDGIILTHRHLDHAADVNIMIEAMTRGGYQKKGTLFAPPDALDNDPVVLQYVRSYLAHIKPLSEGGTYTVGPISFSTPVRHNHPVETYGLKISLAGKIVSLIADTLFFEELASHYYQSDCVIINVVRLQSSPSEQIIYHLCLEDVKKIVSEIRPRKVLLTHFGSQILQANPCLLAEELSLSTGIQTIACTDGLTFTMEELFY